jgi:TonB dependent receptor/Carboxypeptidase regulatory-like domain/TonB-dependent Receptor Plug Domain
MNFTAPAVAALLGAAMLPLSGLPAAAQSQTGTVTTTQAGAITGAVVDQQNGLPLAHATVGLYQGSTRVSQTHTDARGAFAFTGEPPGIYDVVVDAQGYQPSRVSDEALTGSASLNVSIILPRATSGGQGLRDIGHVSASTARNALATTTVVNRSLSEDLISKESNLRVGDALLAQPGLTSFSLDSAPGDDLSISIRGMRPSEVQTLIDGTPVGPLGVFNGTSGGFNYQLTPTFGLSNVEITYGSGGSSLLGVDALAGTINFQSLNPTAKPEGYLEQGFGSEGIQRTVEQATGTVGKLGYAFSNGVEGSVGGFDPQTITQRGLLAGNDTSANIAANTWLVSGNYLLRNDVAKLRYQFNPSTALQLSSYISTSYDDKTGEGDNDFVTPGYAVYAAQQNGLGCALPGGGSDLKMTTDAGTQCATQSQYAAANSGPAGGTSLAYQTQSLQAYDARLTTSSGPHNLVFEGYANKSNLLYNRDNSGFTNQYWTFGYRVSDDIVSGPNDFGVGYFAEHQLYTTGNYGSSGIAYQPGIYSSLGNLFVRDIYDLNKHVTAFFNGNVKTSSVDRQSSFDPRLSLVYRPDGANVFRLSAGRSTQSPNAALQALPLNISTSPAALNSGCGNVSIGTDANPNLKAENGKELEASYGHRFSQDSQIQVVGYEEDLTNVIFSSFLPLSSFGPGATPANIADYYAREAQLGCAAPNFGLTVADNAGAGRFRGIDVTGRYRISRNLYADYGYDVMSAQYFNIPLVAMQNNVSLIDGGAIVGVPFQKANLGLDYTLGDKTEIRMDGFFQGNNNALHRPPFFYANGFISRPLQHNMAINVGVSNIFNSAYQQYGQIGNAVYIPENQFGSDPNSIAEAFSGVYGEEFGLPQRSVTVSLSAKIR